jgi:hypothetical protein
VKGDPPQAEQRHSQLLRLVKEQQQRSQEIRASSLRLRLESQRARKVSLHDLMPLDLAVLTIFRRVYEGRLKNANSSRDFGHLDGLACVIAGVWPIYVYEEQGTAFRRVTGQEVSLALFRAGGKEMRFIDGRPPLQRLAVHVETVNAAVAILADGEKRKMP